jgi:hypothetical protein
MTCGVLHSHSSGEEGEQTVEGFLAYPPPSVQSSSVPCVLHSRTLAHYVARHAIT